MENSISFLYKNRRKNDEWINKRCIKKGEKIKRGCSFFFYVYCFDKWVILIVVIVDLYFLLLVFVFVCLIVCLIVFVVNMLKIIGMFICSDKDVIFFVILL